MTTPETSNQHPIWEGAIVGFLFAVEHGLVPPEAVIPTMSQMCVDFVREGMLADFGELQTYLRGKDAIVQLVAKPFKLEEMPRPDLRVADVITGEPRGHWLMISVGPVEAAGQLVALETTHEANEAALAQDTGMLTI